MRGRNLTILLASPRGFCAGVERAIRMVEQALEDHGPPVYVRHEIVHNRHVVDGLRRMGAVFVEELDEVPDDAVVVFSAHGVPKRVVAEAARRGLSYADATCPLVTKIHREVEQHARRQRTTLFIGHRGHPEVTGTMGQAPEGSVILVENVAQARSLQLPKPGRLAYATQTTLSISETEEIVAVLKERFPDIQEPRSEDICYATTNRQAAVCAIAPRVDLMLVLGARNSSNSVRLVETALRAGCPRAGLIEDVGSIDWDRFDGIARLGLTAGASAPESLVEGVVTACRTRFLVAIEEVRLVDESVSFKVPRMPLRRAS